MLSKSKLEKDVIFTLECLEEDFSPEGHFDSGDKELDRKTVEKIYESLRCGDLWAWCTVKITASIPGIELQSVDYLGGCSYESEEDFKKSGYFEDMKDQVLGDLVRQLSEVADVLKKYQ